MLRSWDFLNHGEERIKPILCHPEFISGSSHSKTLGNTQKEEVVTSTMGQMPKQVRHDKVCRDSKAAFTLAEVLITLGIIGVVAAMTLPTLIQNHQKQVLLTQLKKNYAILNQAVQMMKAEHDGIDPVQMPFVHQQWDHPVYLETRLFGPELAKYLPVVWHKPDEDQIMCFENAEDWNYKYMNGNAVSNRNSSFYLSGNGNGNAHYSWQLNNGACLHFDYGGNWGWEPNATGSTRRRFIIDVNGSDKRPNQIGRDVFYFIFEPDGKILPEGYYLTKEQLKNNGGTGCTNYMGLGCATVIMNNGWSFPKDYPWK